MKDEIINDEDLRKIKVRIKLKKVFQKYNNKKEILLDSVVDKMLENGGYDDQPKANNGATDKLSKYADDHMDAERWCGLIDGLMNGLDDRSYDIIDLVYINTKCKHTEIYGEILDLSESHYYRLRWKAEEKMYKKLVKDYKKL